MPRFLMYTTQRTEAVEANNADHARAIFTGKAWPVNVPPAPRPAERPHWPGALAFPAATPEWQAWYDRWYRELGRQRLAWAHGECLLRISEER